MSNTVSASSGGFALCRGCGLDLHGSWMVIDGHSWCSACASARVPRITYVGCYSAEPGLEPTRAEVENLKRFNQQLSSQLAESNDARATAEAEVESLRAEIEQLRAGNQAMQEHIKTVENERDEARAAEQTTARVALQEIERLRIGLIDLSETTTDPDLAQYAFRLGDGSAKPSEEGEKRARAILFKMHGKDPITTLGEKA